MEHKDKHIGETHGELTIIAPAEKAPNGYLRYYWTRCSCGNVKRLRYDQARRNNDCGLCEDFKNSNVLEAYRSVKCQENM